MKIIAVTGTKGKTTIVRALSEVLHRSGETTLRVDTDGYYVNERQMGTLEESKKLFNLVPTVSPGRYLLAMQQHYPNFVAILEAAIGSGGKAGKGYGLHDIGIFSNVYEDHLGISDDIKTRAGIAKRKSFIFSEINMNGYAVFNADDKLVCSQLKEIPEFRSVQLLPCSFSRPIFDIKSHLSKGGKAFTILNENIVIQSKTESKSILSVKEIPWTFDGKYAPSIKNLLLIIGGLYAFFNGDIPQKTLDALKNYRFDKDGGRLSLIENDSHVKVLIDFAHERQSLSEIARLAKSLKKNSKNRTIGIVRLAPDRTDKMIFDTGKYIAPLFNHLIIYDKIDGMQRKEYIGVKSNIKRAAGEVSEIFFNGAMSSKRKNKGTERIIIESNAVKRASEIAQQGDVVVYICNDDHKKSIAYAQKYFRIKPSV